MAQDPRGDSSRPWTSKQRRSARLGSAARLRYVGNVSLRAIDIECGGYLGCVWVGVRPSVSASQSVNKSINQSISP